MGIFEQFNLPSYTKGKSFAEASKAIQDRFKGREDRDSIETQRELLGRLKEAQEYVKAQEQAQQQQQQQHQMPDGGMMQNGEMQSQDMGQDQFAEGSPLEAPNSYAYGGYDGSIMETHDPYKLSRPGSSLGSGAISGASSSAAGAGAGASGILSGVGGNAGGDAGAGATANLGGAAGGGMSGGAMGAIGQGLGAMGSGLQSAARMKSLEKYDGVVDPKQAQIDADAKMIDTTKDTVASALGPWGALFRGVQKAGQGLGDTIGGDGGAAVSGVFSPEEGTMAAFKDKDMSFGDKLLATIPGVGAVKANQSKKKRMSKAMRDAAYRRQSELSNDFANGGMLGDPTDPKKKSKPIAGDVLRDDDPRLRELNKATGFEFTKEGANAISRTMDPVTSTHKNIYNIQSGVHGPDGEEGYYYWYDDPKNVTGENLGSKRDFVSSSFHKSAYRSSDPKTMNPKLISYLDKTQGKLNRKVPLSSYASLLKDNNTFAYGGAINEYNKGGGFNEFGNPITGNKPWNQEYSYEYDDPNYTQYRGYEGTMSDQDVISNLLSQYEKSKGYDKYYSAEEASKDEATQFGPKGGHSGYANRKNTFDKSVEGGSEGLDKAKEWIGDNKGDIMRYAPVAMNAYQLAKLKKPKHESLARINTRYDRQFADEATYQNLVREEANANRAAILNASGGSAAAARAGLIGSQLSSTKALSDAYSRIAEINRGENKNAQDFNLRIDTGNMNQSNMENDINARNRGNYDTQKSKLLAEIGNNIGDIGKEELFKKYPELMGSYYDSKGKLIKTKAVLEAEKKKKEEEDKKKNK